MFLGYFSHRWFGLILRFALKRKRKNSLYFLHAVNERALDVTSPGGGGYSSYIQAIWVCAALRGMVLESGMK